VVKQYKILYTKYSIQNTLYIILYTKYSIHIRLKAVLSVGLNVIGIRYRIKDLVRIHAIIE